ncbi:hypothetical protein I552_3748 [Mycobacterium xenopi 3993]|nr:hypothetical protein I552_3748 [Mycobacterium xenopi 3993]
MGYVSGTAVPAGIRAQLAERLPATWSRPRSCDWTRCR